jgi:hypothetical protein
MLLQKLVRTRSHDNKISYESRDAEATACGAEISRSHGISRYNRKAAQLEEHLLLEETDQKARKKILK